VRKTKLWCNLIVALSLVIVLLGSTSTPASAGKAKDLKADPRLLQMAEENPDATFMVIVQREVKNKNLNEDDPEAEIEKEGGKVKRKFKLIESFSAELTGKQILKLAKKKKVRWISADAPVVSTAGPGMDTFRDEFASQSYEGNNGTQIWSTGWTEGDPSGDASASTADVGVFRVSNSRNCAGRTGSCLLIAPDIAGGYLYRQVDLSRAVSVWLSFYRNNKLNENEGKSEQVQLQVSADGGTNWATLQTYSSLSNPGAAVDSFDISGYASPNTRIRFLIDKYQSGIRYFYVDDIEIAFAYPSAFLSTVKADQLTLDGQGITVAVVDSGITTNNDDFRSGGESRIIADAYFGNHGNAKDLYGHGTHVAGILGGNGAASNGIYRGVAPGVNLLNLRVSDQNGAAYESNVVNSLQWIYDNKDVYNIRVVNLSLNSTVAQSYHTSPLSAAVEILWFNGIVVVVSAGNNGTAEGPVTLYPPANDPFVITVGATEDQGTGDLGDDHLAVFSAFGITDDGFAKPDLVAPGRNLIAPLSEKASKVYEAHPKHRVGDEYFRMSGTSMSAPVVSGAIALLLQQEPGLSPDQVKYRLIATANQAWPGYNSAQSGAGCLDAYAAVYGTTTENANQGILPSQMLATGEDAGNFGSVGWNSVGWNTVGWNSVGWNSVGWNTVGWNASTWDD
jgi:serine protease AprX